MYAAALISLGNPATMGHVAHYESQLPSMVNPSIV